MTETSSHSFPSSEPFKRGLVQVFTGDGKGKTSAALGIVLRALGHGLRVYIIYFMKGDYPYGERNVLARLPNVGFASFGSRKFIDPAKVTRFALQNASSISGLLLTTECLITDIPEKDKGPMMPPGGMGGMGGGMY